MSGETRVSVPGKLILIGEHSVVYGRPAIVGAVDLRLSVTLRAPESPSEDLRIRLGRLGVDETCSWTSILEYADLARERWSEFSGHPDPASFASVRGDDPAHVVKVALGEAARFAGHRPSPLLVSIDSDIPIGSGFGSSAATAVGVVASYLAHRGKLPDSERLDRLALEVERRQHGLPSGVDHATVIRGGLLWARRTEGGGTSIESLAPSRSLLPAVRVYDSGSPAEPTGTVVAAARERVRETILERMESATRCFRDQVESPRHDPGTVVQLIREFEACLEELGVVPAPVKEIIRRIEAGGGAAKVSGAGSLSGSSAGGILVYHPDPEAADLDRLTRGLRELSVRPGAEGLRVETGQ